MYWDFNRFHPLRGLFHPSPLTQRQRTGSIPVGVGDATQEELRLDAQSREEDMKSVELALQVIQNRTFMHVETSLQSS